MNYSLKKLLDAGREEIVKDSDSIEELKEFILTMTLEEWVKELMILHVNTGLKETIWVRGKVTLQSHGPKTWVRFVRVLRVVEYVGPRDWVEETVAKSIHGEKQFGPNQTIRAATVGLYPEILMSELESQKES